MPERVNEGLRRSAKQRRLAKVKALQSSAKLCEATKVEETATVCEAAELRICAKV